MTETHDGKPKMWDVWVRYQDGSTENLTSGKGKKGPLPQVQAMAAVAQINKGGKPRGMKLSKSKALWESWCEEVL